MVVLSPRNIVAPTQWLLLLDLTTAISIATDSLAVDAYQSHWHNPTRRSLDVLMLLRLCRVGAIRVRTRLLTAMAAKS